MLLPGLLIAALLGVPAEARTDARVLSGRVISGHGIVAGAVVTVVADEPPYAAAAREVRGDAEGSTAPSTKTDSGGVFRVAAPADGSAPFRLSVKADGFVACTTTTPYDPEELVSLGDLRLEKSRSLSGTVVDSRRRPVAGATVSVLAGPPPAAATCAPGGVGVLTAADGRFSIQAGGPPHRLIVRHRGLAPVAMDLPAGRDITVTMARGVELTGIVRGADGRTPQAGAAVRWQGAAPSPWVLSGRDGRFRLVDVPSETGGLVALAEDGSAGERPNLRTGAAGDVEVVLTAVSSLEGRVIAFGSQSPIPGVRLRLRSGNRLLVTRSDQSGRYRFAQLEPRVYRLDAADEQYVAYEREGVRLAVGQSKRLDVVLVAGATLSGQVTDEAGAPIEGAKGQLVRGGETAIAAFLRRPRSGAGEVFTSGPDGRFKATRLTPGSNQALRVRHPGYLARSLPALNLDASARKPLFVRVVLNRGLAITGAVRNERGAPIAGARIELVQPEVFRSGAEGAVIRHYLDGEPRAWTRSGPGGEFRIVGLELGDYQLSVTSPGFASQLQSVAVLPGIEPLEVTLLPAASLAGRVLQRSGVPLSNWRVMAIPSEASRVGPGPAEMVSDGDGFYRIDGLKPGESYDLLAAAAGQQLRARRQAVVAPSDDVDIDVEGYGRVVGHTIDATTGAPVPFAMIGYRAPGAERDPSSVATEAATTTAGRSADGSFGLENVPAGTWELVAEARGYARAIASVVVEAGTTTDVAEVRLVCGLAIRGRVVTRASGKPVADVSILARPVNELRPVALDFDTIGRSTSDVDGGFEISDLAPGAYRLTVRHPSYGDATETVTLEKTDATVHLKLTRGASVGGIVVAPGGALVGGVTVALSREDGPGFEFLRGFDGQETLSDGAGRFRFDHVARGRHRLTGRGPGVRSDAVSIALTGDESRDDVVVRLRAGATVRGVVRGLAPEHGGDVRIEAWGAEGYASSARTDSAGAFELSAVTAGPLVLRASAGTSFSSVRRMATARLTVPENEGEVSTEILFEGGFVLTGRVTQGGQAVHLGKVLLVEAGTGRTSGWAQLDEGGRYRIDGLEAGLYFVLAQAASGGSRRRQVHLERDTDLDLDIATMRLTGMVTAVGSMEALADVTVELVLQSSDTHFRWQAKSDAGGRFGLNDLDPGAYVLTATRQGYRTERRTIEVAEDGSYLVVEMSPTPPVSRSSGDGT